LTQLLKEISFKSGIRDGIHRKYDRKGNIRQERNYSNGRITELPKPIIKEEVKENIETDNETEIQKEEVIVEFVNKPKDKIKLKLWHIIIGFGFTIGLIFIAYIYLIKK
jgi:hypothetical protein